MLVIVFKVVARRGSGIEGPVEESGAEIILVGIRRDVSWGPGALRGVAGIPVCKSFCVSISSWFRAERAGAEAEAGAETGVETREGADMVERVGVLENEPEFERAVVGRAAAGRGDGMLVIGTRVFSVLVAGLVWGW